MAAAAGLLAAETFGRPGVLTGVWALPDRAVPSVGDLLVWTALGSGLLLPVFTLALAPRGRGRIAGLVGLGIAAAVGATLVTFGKPGGDSVANLAAHAALDPGEGHLFVGGEFLGHLWFVPWFAAASDGGHGAAIWAARAAGWPGLIGLLACAALLSGGLPTARERWLTACATCAMPFTLLLLGYPQSTALMSALVPCFLAAGLAALDSPGHPARWAAGCAALLALACTAHGTAYVLGLGTLWLLFRWIRRGHAGAAMVFVAVFAVLWAAISTAEWSLIHRARTMPWSFLARAFEPAGLAGCFGGPLLDDPGPSGLAAAGAALWRWVLSLAPLAAVAPVVLITGGLGRFAGRSGRHAGSGATVDRIAFVALCAAGGLALWATWSVWYGYPADWDVTAIAALTLQLTCVGLLGRLPHPRLREAALAFAIPLQLLTTLALAARFTGSPG